MLNKQKSDVFIYDHARKCDFDDIFEATVPSEIQFSLLNFGENDVFAPREAPDEKIESLFEQVRFKLRLVKSDFNSRIVNWVWDSRKLNYREDDVTAKKLADGIDFQHLDFGQTFEKPSKTSCFETCLDGENYELGDWITPDRFESRASFPNQGNDDNPVSLISSHPGA